MCQIPQIKPDRNHNTSTYSQAVIAPASLLAHNLPMLMSPSLSTYQLLLATVGPMYQCTITDKTCNSSPRLVAPIMKSTERTHVMQVKSTPWSQIILYKKFFLFLNQLKIWGPLFKLILPPLRCGGLMGSAYCLRFFMCSLSKPCVYLLCTALIDGPGFQRCCKIQGKGQEGARVRLYLSI